MINFVIYLRDLRGIPAIIQVRRETDPLSDLSNLEETAFLEFVQMAREVLPLKQREVDVYIGWWGGQSTIRIPREFFELIAETNWPVTFDIND